LSLEDKGVAQPSEISKPLLFLSEVFDCLLF